MNGGIKELIHSAVKHQHAGRLDQAERIYRKILTLQPGHPGALQMLGVIAHQIQDFDAAVKWLTQAAAAMPNVAAAHFNLGNALRAQHHPADAETSLRRAIDLKPDFAEAHSTLAAVLSEQGRIAEAETSLHQALKLKPDNPVALNNLGNLLKRQEKLAEAQASFRHAIAANSGYGEAHCNLGMLLKEQGFVAEAEASFREGIRTRPELPASYVNLGNLLEQQGRSTEAEAILRQVIGLKPDYAEAHNNLGNVLTSLGRPTEAEASLRRAIALQPDYAAALYNLGTLLRYQGKLAEAEILLRRSIELDPRYPEAHNNLGTVLRDQGRMEEARAALKRALTLQQDFTKAHSNLVFYKHYLPGITPERLLKAHRRWNDLHASKFRSHWGHYGNTRQPDRRLRVGYVSPDFREHSVAYFFAPLLSRHAPRKVETFLYSDATVFDSTTRRLQELAAQWRTTNRLSDAQLEEQIRADGIDILVDLAGHTANNRLLVFARRPAPVQYTYLGYPCTTGLSAIDYRITDKWADPPDSADPYYSEELVRLRGGFLCYQPPQDAPLPSAPPLETSGFVTFGSFNERAKITNEVLETWCSIMQSVADSRLLLKCRSFADQSARESCFTILGAHGIGRDRVALLGPLANRADHLATYHRIDIGLDTFPYNGATTTCEALWMGVPVITVAGNTHAGRVGASLFHNLGLPSLITDSLTEYVGTACRLANDPEKLSALRATLRDRFRQSPLCDGQRLARAMEQAFRLGWRRWCRNPSP